ncbi:hypothetical protein TNCV_3634551 [Trichonephila clavipes]|nr:hypothetical protein TNCV_3634551 [Trichonephila clavipes]
MLSYIFLRIIDVATVTSSWLVCLEFEPSTAEEPPIRRGRCTVNLSRHRRFPVSVEVKRRRGFQLSLSGHLTMVQNYEVRRQ